jgi:hypothetical protein
MTNNTLKQYAHTLRLSGLLSTLELRLKEAEASRLPYAQFLREQRTIAQRHKAADFRELRSLDNFDFAFNPFIDRAITGRSYRLQDSANQRASKPKSSPQHQTTNSDGV